MRFIDRVKKILSQKNQNELAKLEEKIRELEEIYSFETESNKKLKQEANEVSENKGKFQKN